MTCHWCDLPETAHPVYRQIDGEHDYEPRIDEPPIARPDRPRERPCVCATSHTPGQHHCGPSETPSDRLPSYQTGRVATDRAPLDPAEEFQRELVRLRPFLGPAIDQVARDLQKQDRPGLLRRIWDAARKDST